MNRKWIALLLSCALVLMLATACGRRDDPNDTVTTPDNNVNDGLNNNDMNNNGMNNNNGNTNTPGDMTPGNEYGNGMDDNGNVNSTEDDPVFPNSLATMDADVAVDDLFDTLGLAESDLDNAMRDIATVGDGVDGARTYRHRLLGQDADVSYGFDDQRMINKVTVKAQADSADEWRNELTDTLGAEQVEGELNSWKYNDNNVKISDQGDHVLITIEKNA